MLNAKVSHVNFENTKRIMKSLDVRLYSVLNRLKFTGSFDVLPKNSGLHRKMLGCPLGLKKLNTISYGTKKNIPVSNIYFILLVEDTSQL